jgi:hypothetical protein
MDMIATNRETIMKIITSSGFECVNFNELEVGLSYLESVKYKLTTNGKTLCYANSKEAFIPVVEEICDCYDRGDIICNLYDFCKDMKDIRGDV